MTTLIKSNGLGRKGFFPEFPAVFDDLLIKDLFNPSVERPAILPAVNIKETTAGYNLEVAVPGMDKKDFKIELKENILVISAQKENKQEEKNENSKYVRKEFGYQSFTRSFTLPEDSVDAENISASYTGGILNITVPKKEKETRSKEIQIS